ncbi:MAG: V-type ATP synthase subunit F [Synergistales bacterium]|jgi:vacuolar-type H+-ATPase subunit F/Vma7
MTNRTAERAIVVGEQVFVDLWALLGFERLVCEDPAALGENLKLFLEGNVSLVIVEQDWFGRVPDFVRQRLTKMQKPVWIAFPGLKSSVG